MLGFQRRPAAVVEKGSETTVEVGTSWAVAAGSRLRQCHNSRVVALETDGGYILEEE